MVYDMCEFMGFMPILAIFVPVLVLLQLTSFQACIT